VLEVNQKVRLALVLAVLGLAGRSDATNVSGTIASNTTWTLAASPYVVTSTVTVNSAATLTIEAGATVTFNAGTQLVLNGKLTAIGTSNSPILFTSSSGSPTPGSWGNIFFNSGAVSGSQISYATISYGGNHGTDNGALVVVGGNPTFGNVTVSGSSSHGFNMGGSSATIQNCTSTGNAWYGLSVWYGAATVTNSTFSGNGDRGIGVFNTSTASLSNVTISGNGNFAIQMDATAQLTSLSGITATGNGGGSKNLIAVSPGSTPVGAAWHPGLPYQVQGTNAVVTVPSGRTLTIDPGVTVQFPSGGQLSVFGKLVAAGTAPNPIFFTSSGGSPAPGAWGNIYFQAGSSTTSQISYATVSYGGGSGFYGAVRVNGGSPTFDHVTVSSSGSHGFDLPGGAGSFTSCTSSGNTWDGLAVWQATATVSDTTLTGNSGFGLNVLNSSSAALSNVTITNNGGYAIQMAASAQITSMAGVTATGNGGGVKNQIAVVAGTTPSTVTWRAGLPYVMSAANSIVTVPGNGTMTIEPGATILFTSGSQLSVGGRLLAVGTAGSPITFTSSAASPTPGSWRNIYFSSSTPGSQLSYATISYAGSSDYGALVVNAGTPTLDHVTVTASGNNGINVTGGAATIQNSTVSGSAATGISVWNSAASAAVSNTTLSGNAARGLNAANFASASLSNVAITNNGDFALGIDANGRLTSLTGVTASGNGGGAKDVIGVDTALPQSIPSQTWHPGLPYRLSSTDASLSVNGTLTIDPGVTVQFPSGGRLSISGKLLAVGTALNPITFTSSSANPTAGSWRNIYFNTATPGSQISYASVSYAGSTDSGAIVHNGGVSTLDHVTVTGSASNGIYVSGGAALIQNSTVAGSAAGGISVWNSNASATVSDTALTGNTGRGLNAANYASAALSNVAITNNGDFAMGIDANGRLTSLTGVTASGNAGGTKDVIGVDTGPTMTITNQVWHPGFPYRLSATDATLNAGGVLTIDPGVVVQFPSGGRLNVVGKLLALGTAENPISFTSSSASPAPGSWKNIYFNSVTPGSQISYATVSYAGSTDYGAIVHNLGVSTLDHVAVTGSASNGINVTGGTLALTGSALSGNAGVGLNIANSANTYVATTSFTGNAGGGVSKGSGTSIAAAAVNYWGAADGPSGVGPGSGQSVTLGAPFDPWLVSASSPTYEITSTTFNRRFNPDAGDTATWGVAATSTGNWQIAIKNGQGTTIRTLTGSGATTTLTWDGKDGNGVAQPDGSYSYLLDVTSAGGTAATQARGNAVIDRTLAVAITSPTGPVVSNVYSNGATDIPIVGSASASGIVDWVLDYGAGAQPTSWTTLASSVVSALNTNLGTWQTGSLANGPYVLRLRLVDNGSSLITRTVPVVVGNYSMSQTGLQANASAGQTISYSSIVPFALTETIVLKDEQGTIRRTLFSGVRQPGTFVTEWNGNGDAGTIVPDGAYFYSSVVTDGTHGMSWDLSDQVLNDVTIAHNDGVVIPSWDPFKNQELTASYSFSFPGRVRIALSEQTGHFTVDCAQPTGTSFCPVFDRYESSGSHTFHWVGLNHLGQYVGEAVNRIGFFSSRGTFAKNAAVLFGTQPTLTGMVLDPVRFESGASQTATVSFGTYLSHPAAVQVTYQNLQTQSVLRTITLGNQSPGAAVATWDGRGDNGVLVAPGQYLVTATVIDDRGDRQARQLLTIVE